jgi:holliday junction resolvase Hjr
MAPGRKGSNSERELLKMFVEVGWACIRIAGSGKMESAPDLVAGHPGKLLVIECKSSGKPALYIDNLEILDTIEYANKFGGEPWYAFRFDRTEWHFIPAHSLLGSNKVIPESGIKFDMLILKDRKTM